MLASCLCPTHGRPPGHQHLLEEAVESFLRQTERRCELLVLNDCPQQELKCSAPGVRVVNAPSRYPTLGDKYNAMVRLARSDVLLPWEDDDVSLPWRVEQALAALAGGAEYFNPGWSWYMSGGTLHSGHAQGFNHNASAFRRAAWRRVGGYSRLSGAQDGDMDRRLRLASVMAPALGRDPCEWSYVYRWGVSDCHLSGQQDTAAAYAARGSAAQPGSYALEPGWAVDYAALALTACGGRKWNRRQVWS